MSLTNLPSSENLKIIEIQNEINRLQNEFDAIERKLHVFENQLRLALEDSIIEVQELTVVYKKLKKEKKEKRFEQKKRGKNYKESSELIILHEKDLKNSDSSVEKKERKKLYREAMLNVHPDKFSLNETQQDLATDVTSNLIEIYKTGTLEELKFYHSKIMRGLLLDGENKINDNTIDHETYLKKQLLAIQNKLSSLKKKHTYIVLTTYENPMDFQEELQAYYQDKIEKLKKRTRKAR